MQKKRKHKIGIMLTMLAFFAVLANGCGIGWLLIENELAAKRKNSQVGQENPGATQDSAQRASVDALWETAHGVIGTVVYAGEVIQAQEAERKAQEEAEEAEARAQLQSGDSSRYVDEVIRLVNIERANAGLDPLVKSDILCQIAEARASEIKILFSHTRPNGTKCFTILKEYGISYKLCAENIAAGQKTPAKVVEDWMNSPGHRANILDPRVQEIGVGVVYVEDGYHRYYWAQLFRS